MPSPYTLIGGPFHEGTIEAPPGKRAYAFRVGVAVPHGTAHFALYVRIPGVKKYEFEAIVPAEEMAHAEPPVPYLEQRKKKVITQVSKHEGVER